MVTNPIQSNPIESNENWILLIIILVLTQQRSSACQLSLCLIRTKDTTPFNKMNLFHQLLINITPLGGLEPPAFRLTAERASQLRHRGSLTTRLNRHYTPLHSLGASLWVYDSHRTTNRKSIFTVARMTHSGNVYHSHRTTNRNSIFTFASITHSGYLLQFYNSFKGRVGLRR